MRRFDPARVPAEVPVLGVRGTVLFPAASVLLTLQGDEAVSAARAAAERTGLLAVALRRTPPRDDGPYHRVATLAAVADLLGRTEVRCRLVGLVRVELLGLRPEGRHAVARVRVVEDVSEDVPASAAAPRDRRLRDRLVEDGPDAFPDLALPELRALLQVEDRAQLADLVLAHLPVPAAEKHRGLAEPRVDTRLALASSLVDRAVAEAAARRHLLDDALRGVRLVLWRAWRPPVS
jgi:ATP-dependent Lon protease